MYRSAFRLAMVLIVVAALFGCRAEGDDLAASGTPPPDRMTTRPDDTPAPTATVTATRWPTATPGVTATSTPTVLSRPTAAPTSPPPFELITRLVSIAADGRLDKRLKDVVRISGDGRYAVYSAIAKGTWIKHVSLRDLEAGVTTPVTTAPDGTLADKWSFAPSISDDGSTVAFFSFASNLVGDAYQECRTVESGETEPCGSLYIYDVVSGALEWIAVAAAPSTHPDTALSADGRYVAFAAPQAYLREGVFLYDRGTEDITPISAGDSSEPPSATNSGGFAVDISADGRYVAFASLDDDIVPDDTNGGIDVFVYDRIAAQIERISTPVDGIESGQPSGYQAVPNTGGRFESGLSISADGRYVVFMSAAPNLVDRHLSPCQHWPWVDAFPACRHIYLYDRETGTTELISVSDDGTPGNRASEDGDVSADGRWVVFTSLADNLTADGPIRCQGYTMEGACPQVYVRDREQGRTYLVSRGWNGQLPNANSSAGVITPDGRYVAFISAAGNLVPDVPFSQDRHIFIADLFRLTGCVETPVTPTFLPPVPVATVTQTLQPTESPVPPLATPTSSQAPTSTPTSPQTPVAGDCAGPFCRTGAAQAELSRSSASWTSREELAIPLDEAMLALDAALRGEIAAYLNAHLNPTHPLADQMEALDALRTALPNAGDNCTILPANLDCDQFDELVVWNCANMPMGLLFTVTEEPLPDGRIILRWEDPTLSWSEEKIAFVWTGDALVEVDPETYEPLPPGWPGVGGLHF